VKRRIVIFLSVVLLSLLVVPLANILFAPNRDAIKWQQKTFLYNIDFVSRWLAKVLYPFGISTDPKQVIIGYDDWLYLGDQYNQTLSVDRRRPTSADVELGKQIGAAIVAWDAYFASKGVKLFRIMIGPNKGTVYPEHMPSWAKPVSPNATDALLAGTGAKNYVDLRDVLLEAKANQAVDLYYKTDTHWNNLGAAIAFHAFAQQVGAVVPDLRWPSDAIYDLSRIVPRAGGDLANFLRLSGSLSDSEPMIHVQDLSVETTQVDFDTKQVIHKGGNPAVRVSLKPLLVKSLGALNNKKVLWLRDSFGNAMSPLMAATFSDVLQLHWGEAIKPGGRLVQLVENWKPDYVFFTVVERASRAGDFAAFPPPVVLSRGGDFKPIRTTAPVRLNHLIDGRSKSEHHINGNDPFIDFALSDAITPSEVLYLSIDLTCDDGATLVPLQLFWLENGRPYFDEEHSAHFSFPVGSNLLDLNTLPKWKSAVAISRLRLDIISQNTCAGFKLNNPALGLLRSEVDGKS
jgi:alginate O-acetyltransferase complex protein AlgJ